MVAALPAVALVDLVHNILLHSHTAILHSVSICHLVWHRHYVVRYQSSGQAGVGCALFTVWAVCWPRSPAII